MFFITQFPLKLIKNLLAAAVLTSFIASGCKGVEKPSLNTIPRLVQMATPSGALIKTHMAITSDEQTMGLSGKRPNQFSKFEGMLFLYGQDGERQFWMPDTYFDLDLFFLNKDLKIIAIHRNLKHHPGRHEPPPIARSKRIYSRHVLEMRADSPLAKSLKVGDDLKWMEKSPLSEIESKIRLWQ